MLFNKILTNFITFQIQKQSPIGVPQNLRSGNIQQIYRRTCRSVILVKLQTNFIEITLPHGYPPVNVLHICKTVALANTYGELLLKMFIQHTCHIFQYQFASKLGYFLIYIWIVQCSDVQCWDIQVFYSISFVFQNSLFTFSDSFHVNCILSSFIYLSFFTRWCLTKLLSKCYLTCYVAFSFEKLFYKKNSFFYWYFRPCNIESLPEKIFLNTFINILSLSYLVMTLKLIFRLSIPELPH